MSNISVIDSITSNPVSGAGIFINGVGNGITNSSGQASVSLPAGSSYDLSVKATGYNTYLVNGVSADLPIQINIVKTVPTSTTSFKLNITPEDTIIGVPITFSNIGNPITVTYTEGGITVPGLLVASQVVTGTAPNYNSINQTFDLSKATQGTILLTASSDTGTAAKKQQTITQDPITSALIPQLTPANLPEFIAPNTSQGTYFTMTQARMYIGNLFIDELNGLQFALQDNKIPIYGYASRFYDAIAQGKSLVQGQFTINFVSEGYLVTTLREYVKVVNTGTSQIDVTAQQQQARLTLLTNSLANPDPAWTPAIIAKAKAEIKNLAATLGPAGVAVAAAGMNAINKQLNNNVLGLAGGDYPNAVYEDTPFDIIINYTGAGRTVTRKLEDCRLISNESIMDHSGTPILDSYGFIARRLR